MNSHRKLNFSVKADHQRERQTKWNGFLGVVFFFWPCNACCHAGCLPREFQKSFGTPHRWNVQCHVTRENHGIKPWTFGSKLIRRFLCGAMDDRRKICIEKGKKLSQIPKIPILLFVQHIIRVEISKLNRNWRLKISKNADTWKYFSWNCKQIEHKLRLNIKLKLREH